VDFIPLVIWNQPAEYLCRYASKGTKIAVTGKLTTRKYEDKSGNKRTAFEVIGDAVEICTSASENAAAPKSEPPAYTPSAYGGTTAPQFEEIPNDEGLPF
jgi:single-strand DNA-binding protein